MEITIPTNVRYRQCKEPVWSIAVGWPPPDTPDWRLGLPPVAVSNETATWCQLL